MRLHHAFIIVATLTLVGCAVDQDKEVALYRKVLDADATSTQTTHAADEPLTLGQALELANRNNEQLGVRGEEYVQSLIAKNRAVSNFLPTVELQPSYRLTGTPLDGVGGTRVGDKDNRFQLPIVGRMNLFRGGADVAEVRSAAATIAQRRELLLDAQMTVLLNVSQVYYQIIRSERQVQVLSHSLQTQQARLADIQGRFRNGLATALDVAQSQARADATSVSLIRAHNDVDNGRVLLARLIGIPAVRGPLVDDFHVPASIDPVADFESRATAQRPDILAAQSAIEAARHNVDIAFAQYYPSVSINTSAFMVPENYASPAKWNALLVANVPIFTAGIIEADVRNAWSRLRQAGLEETGVRREALKDVQTAYNNLTSNDRAIAGLRSQVAAASEAYNLSRNAYLNGLAINLDVLTAQDELLIAQLNLASAEYDRTIFYLDLLRATGELNLKTPRGPTPPLPPGVSPAVSTD
jgi:outer membrane protein TolC